MNCPACAAHLPDGAMFCGGCGSAVIARSAAPASAPPPEHLPPGSGPFAPEPPAATSVPAPAAPLPERPAMGPAALPERPLGGSAALPPRPGSSTELDERTRLPAIRPTPTVARFVLQFSTGEAVTVTGSGLVGRRPQAQPGEEFEVLVPIDDPARSVSKTHLEFGQEGGSFWVSDRFSANGTVVREPDKPGRLCAPGMRTRVARGSRVEMGEQFFVVS